MQNNLLDEFIADYMGIVKAIGYYRADWFLRFIGLENFPNYRAGGRLENYRGNPPLSDGAFKILHALVKDAAENVERFSNTKLKNNQHSDLPLIMLLTLTQLTLEEMASPESEDILKKAFIYASEKLQHGPDK